MTEVETSNEPFGTMNTAMKESSGAMCTSAHQMNDDSSDRRMRNREQPEELR